MAQVTRSLSGPLYLKHQHGSSGNGDGSAFWGQLVEYNTPRTQVNSGPVRLRVSAWGGANPFLQAQALRFSLRTAAGPIAGSNIQIPRGQTGFYTLVSNLPAGTQFYISARAVGSCQYATPGGAVSDPIGHEFTWAGEIQYQL